MQNAVANEMQSGGSAATTRATSESESEAWSDSSGVVQSILGSSSGGSGGWQSATTEATSRSSSWSIGSRSVLAELSQTVNDRTEQHASSVRNRRASAVREVSQSEHEQISTRIVANYNHMHALTVQYYEVVQIYRTIAQLHRATRCLFVPLELLDFTGEDALSVVEHFRGALLAGALTRRAASLLADDTTTVAVEPAAPTKLIGRRPELLGVRVARMARAIDSSGSSASPAEPEAEAEVPEPSRSLPFRTWNPGEVARVSKLLSRPVIRPDSDNLFLPDDTELVGISFAGANITKVRLDSEAGSESRTVTTESNYVEFAAPVRLLEIDALHVAKADQAAATGTVTLHCSYMGRRFSAPSIPMQLPAGTGLSKAVSFMSDQADRRKELLAHLQANRAHYSQAIFRRLDAATITMLLSKHTWNGRPLAEQVEPRPYTVAGNYLVLPAPVEDDEPSGVAGANGETLAWGRLLAERRLSRGDVDQRLIPIPTGGVFAEAVLGRSNSAEKLDITRFWNWQDSPIPLTPPEIAPIAAGSRATAEALQPGHLSQPLLNIVNPQALPDPSGMAAVLGALSSGNMFRDMSGLAGTQGMAQGAVSETISAAMDAGKLASENMRTQAQKAVSMGQIAADVAKTAIGGHYALAQAKAGASSPKGPGSGGSVQGISGDGARINHGRAMDERKVPGTGGTSASTSSGNGSAAGGSGAGGGGGNGSGAPLDAQPGSSFSREAAYADTGAFGYSPEGFHNTRPPTVTEIPPVVFASYGSGGAASFFLQRLKHVTTVLGFFVSKPVKVFLNLHKTHFDVLGKVLDAVRRGRQIQNVITAAEANLMRFRDEATGILNHAQSIPQDPLEGIPNWSLQDLEALRDPAAVRARQDYLNRYRETVTTALQVAQNLVQVGERIDSESRPLLQQLHTEVQNLPSSNNAEAVVKQAIYQDVQFLELFFSKYVAPSVRNAEAAVSYLTTAKANIEAILQ